MAAKKPATEIRHDPALAHWRRGVLGLLTVTIAAAGGWAWWSMRETERAERVTQALAAPAHFVGAQACASCHRPETEAWSGSHHAKAMQQASEATVLGAFDGRSLVFKGVTSTFFRRDGRFFVNTEGPDGHNRDYPIRYTFGVDPLQQYLVEFPDGKLQALGLAWDARAEAEGGQRWFHLYPDDTPRPGDALHWTGRDQTWNYQCAGCHSTGLKANYDPALDRYATRWRDINVSCEACHGPASRHVAWAEGRLEGLTVLDLGLVRRLASPGDDRWSFTADPARIAAERLGPERGSVEVETCSACHARRRPLDTAAAGEPGRFLDHFSPALLERGLYHADGRIRDEVFETGSFLQSRMYRAGVSCSNCHDAHTLELRAPGNAVCLQCHAAPKFDTVEHFRHLPGGAGAQCVACHMPQTFYMVVDGRRDHGLRVPRPDLADQTGSPSACMQCHADRGERWAADAIAGWFGDERRQEPHFGEALHAAWNGRPEARRLVLDFLGRPETPSIARASLLGQLPVAADPGVLEALRQGAADADPLVRAAALRQLDGWPLRERVRLTAAGLADPVRAVRIEAARTLADAPAEALSPAQRQALEQGLAELETAELATAERPESHLNLALLAQRRGQAERAEAELRTALRLDPGFAPAYVNLADLHRETGREAEAEQALLEALERAPGAAESRHALGLLRVRQNRPDEALALLAEAARLAPEQVRYAYVHGVALHSYGKPEEALAVLRAAAERRPNDAELLTALATISRDLGRRDEARRYAEQWLAAAPDDLDAQRLLESLR